MDDNIAAHGHVCMQSDGQQRMDGHSIHPPSMSVHLAAPGCVVPFSADGAWGEGRQRSKAQRWMELRTVPAEKGGAKGTLKGQERPWIHKTTESRDESLNQDVGPQIRPSSVKILLSKKVNC